MVFQLVLHFLVIVLGPVATYVLFDHHIDNIYFIAGAAAVPAGLYAIYLVWGAPPLLWIDLFTVAIPSAYFALKLAGGGDGSWALALPFLMICMAIFVAYARTITRLVKKKETRKRTKTLAIILLSFFAIIAARIPTLK